MRILGISLICTLGLVQVTTAETIVYDNFASTEGLTLNGAATKATNAVDGNVLRLVTTSAFLNGSTFYNSALDLSRFSSEFTFRISNRGGPSPGDGADGIAFVLQTSGPAALGGVGGYMGFNGITPVIAVQFDTQLNTEFHDPSDNYVGISIGSVDHGIGSPFTRNVATDFDDGQLWTAWIDYDGSNLEVRANTTGIRPTAALVSRTIDLTALLGGTSAYVGFTSGTGYEWGNHDIVSWRLTSVPEPSSLLSAALGLLGLLGYAGLRRFRRTRP